MDVARVELEGRVHKTKETVSAWLEEAKEKAPCLLILDGLDSLLMPEQEVRHALH
jgi:peroxin-1